MTADGERLELLEPRWTALLGGGSGIGLAWATLALNPTIRGPWTVGIAAVVTAIWLPLAVMTQRRRRRGVRLTRSGITIQGLRVRRFAWSDVERFELQDPRLTMVTRRGDRVTLPLPVRSRRDPDGFEREVDQVIDWWRTHGEAHRG